MPKGDVRVGGGLETYNMQETYEDVDNNNSNIVITRKKWRSDCNKMFLCGWMEDD